MDKRESGFFAEQVNFTEYYQGKPVWTMNAEDIEFDITLTNGIINQVIFKLKSVSDNESEYNDINVSAKRVDINTKQEELIFTGNVVAEDSEKRRLETNRISYYPNKGFLKSNSNIKFKDHNIELTSKGAYIYPNEELIKFTSNVHAYFFPKENSKSKKQ